MTDSHPEGPLVTRAATLPTTAPSRSLGLRLPAVRVAVGRWPARAALAVVVVLAAAIAVAAAAQPSVLVPRSGAAFPDWFSGPLHGIAGGLTGDPDALSLGLTAVIGLMAVAYLVALAGVRALSMRQIAVAVVLVHAVMLLAPPLQLTDVFNYLGYGRLGALHGLNPYRHVIAEISRDPVYRFSTWHHLRSPYGPAFSALTYPLALLPLPVAYWALKGLVVALSLALVAIVHRCAVLLGRDPRFAVLFVAVNPITVVWALGGFHNDVVSLVPATGAIALLLARRDRSAGAALALAVAVKFTAVLLLPFLLVMARPSRRRWRVLQGLAAAAAPLLALSLALFGTALPNLSDQSTLLTDFSIPNVIGLLIGAGGGAPWLLKVASALVVVAIGWLLRRRREPIAGAGWATLALIASLSWLMPWYITWLLPLAALAQSERLRRATLALGCFLVLTFVPATGMITARANLDPLSGSAGHVSWERQGQLQ